jgi:Ser/Thr protein kinase RdoA (MazF antagonist)
MATPSQVLLELPAVVGRSWALIVESAEILTGGMNSVVVLIATTDGRFVAKWVPQDDASDLLKGAEVARTMSDFGIRAGRPRATIDGALVAPLLDGQFVLLEEVPGEPLGRTREDLRDWSTALGRVHSAGTWMYAGEFFPWLRENGIDPARELWVQRAVTEVLAEYDGLPALTWAQLHTDPEPEAFRRDSHGNVGVIDWTGSTPGPVLYDVASAAMYAGSEPAASRLIAGYLSAGILPESELRAHLGTFQRFRAAVQAVYFSQRLHDANLTGIASQLENEEGLRDARTLLREAGLSLVDQP